MDRETRDPFDLIDEVEEDAGVRGRAADLDHRGAGARSPGNYDIRKSG